MKLVSIILPTYNGAKFIKESIESVINQTYTNWELIIVNDCSTDDTTKIIEEYTQKDSRIKVITNKENKKLPASLNIGFEHASGDYYTWTSDDNAYKKDAIKYMSEFLDNNQEIDLISCNADFVDENGVFINEFTTLVKHRCPLQLAKQCNIGACFMYRKEIAEKAGEYNTEMFCAEDYDYWCKIALAGRIAYSDKNLYKYRLNSQSLTATKQATIKEKTLTVQQKYKKALIKKYKKINKKFYLQKIILPKIESFIFKKEKNGTEKHYKILGIKINMNKKQNYLNHYKRAKNWIKKYTVDNKGIVVTSKTKKLIYPEVSGYFIPTLIKFGNKELAKSFGNYLISIQNSDGSWNEPSGKTSFTFDTGMILKGLWALIQNGLDENNKFKTAFLQGADYIISRQTPDGAITTEDYSQWNLPYGKKVPEAIHLYCLEPIMQAGEILNIESYKNCVSKAKNYYLKDETLTDFKTLSHFNAYIIEGLIDIGETARAKRAMDLISLEQKEDGSVSAYPHVNFVCSTGILQYAICWYKLGEIEKADKAFNYAVKLQNKSGGWFGSYGKNANYFPKEEISWAVKYFLDAIYYGQIAKYGKFRIENFCIQVGKK